MKKLTKAILIFGVVLMLFAAAGVFGLGWYVGSENGRARIELELGKALGVPLTIERAQLSFSGLRLSRVRVVAEGQTFLEAPAFTAGYKLLPLLHREVVLSKMVLESPSVVWPQNAEGKWVLPTHPKGPKSSAPEELPKQGKKEASFALALDTLEIRNGAIVLLDEKQQRFAAAQQVHIDVSLAQLGTASGEATASTVAVMSNSITVEKVRLPFQYAGGKLTFTKFDGELGGGSVSGDLGIDTKAQDTPFDLQLALEKVDLGRAITDPSWQIRGGELRAALELHGASHDTGERRTGHGEMHVTNAAVDVLEPLLRLVGETCHIPELAKLRLSLNTNLMTFAPTLGIPETLALRSADAAFQMTEKATTIERFMVDAGDLTVGAKGTIAADGKLDLEATLNVSESLARQLPSLVRDTLGQTPGSGRRGIAFNITGKNDRPKTNLLEKMLGGKVGDQIGDIVSSIFGSKKDKDEKDRQREEEKREKKEEKKKKKEEEKKAAEAAAAAAGGAAPVAPPPAEPGGR